MLAQLIPTLTPMSVPAYRRPRLVSAGGTTLTEKPLFTTLLLLSVLGGGTRQPYIELSIDADTSTSAIAAVSSRSSESASRHRAHRSEHTLTFTTPFAWPIPRRVDPPATPKPTVSAHV